MPDTNSVHERLEYLRGELRAERISMGELIELQGLAEHIEPGDVELLEAAGVPEHGDRATWYVLAPVIAIEANSASEAFERVGALDDAITEALGTPPDCDGAAVRFLSPPHPIELAKVRDPDFDVTIRYAAREITPTNEDY